MTLRLTHSRIRQWISIVAALGAVLTGVILWRTSDSRHLKAWLRGYEQAERSGDVDRLVALTGPLTRTWMETMLRIARTGSREELIACGYFDTITVIELRHAFSRRELEHMTVEDALRWYVGKWNPNDAQPRELSEVVADDDGASASLWTLSSKGDSRLFLGEGRLFSRSGQEWRFNWHLPFEHIMNMVSAGQDKRSLGGIIEKSCSDCWHEPFDARLWDGPRP